MYGIGNVSATFIFDFRYAVAKSFIKWSQYAFRVLRQTLRQAECNVSDTVERKGLPNCGYRRLGKAGLLAEKSRSRPADGSHSPMAG